MKIGFRGPPVVKRTLHRRAPLQVPALCLYREKEELCVGLFHCGVPQALAVGSRRDCEHPTGMNVTAAEEAALVLNSMVKVGSMDDAKRVDDASPRGTTLSGFQAHPIPLECTTH